MKIVSVLRFDKEDKIYRVYNPSKNALCMEQLPRIGEKLVLDMVEMMDNCVPYEVERNYEFAPIKNKTGKDSLESARELLKVNGIEF